MLIIATSLLCIQIRIAPTPPFRREATVAVFENSYDPCFAVSGDMFIAGSQGEVVCYQLPSLVRKWAFKTPNQETPESLVVTQGSVYVATGLPYRKKTAHVVALNFNTGKPIWSMQTSVGGSPMAVTKEAIYLSLTPYTVSALNLQSRKVKWTTKLPQAHGEGLFEGRPEAIAYSDNKVFVNLGSVSYGLDGSNGKQQWRIPSSYFFHTRFLISDGVVWVPQGEGSVGRTVKTGQILWKSAKDSVGDACGVFNGKFIGIDHGQLLALEPKTGKVAWSHDVGPRDTSGGNQFLSVVGGKLFAQGISKSTIVDSVGKIIWEGNRDNGLAGPYWTNGSTIVCFDSQRLLRYVHGKDAELPTDSDSMQALAERMVARYDELDSKDIRRLEGFGDDAFGPLLKLFLKICNAYDAKGDRDSVSLYRKYHDVGQSLLKVGSSNRTADLMAAIDKCKHESTAKPLLLEMLAKTGDAQIVTPYFLRELEGVVTPKAEMYESSTYVAREYVTHSSDPRAVAFMIKQLKDPKADSNLRAEAYLHLAGTGGKEGLEAVLAARNSRTLLEPILKRALNGYLNAGEFGKKPKPLAEKKDTNGNVWGLLESGVLGSAGDLWLAQKDTAGSWSKAYFTGVSTSGISRWAKPKPPEPKFAGKTAKQLTRGEWFKVLVGSSELMKDSDGDGLTDIEERRLGTNPNSKDTDGDGDGDDVDPWPNAAPRQLSNAEQVLATVFEARFHGDGGFGAGLFFAPEDIKPFELAGRNGPMLWVSSKEERNWELPLEQCYEQGVAFIQFTPAREGKTGPWEERLIQWNKEKTEAIVSISVYYGGLNGTGYSAKVKKFGDKWVVTSMKMEYIS